MSIAIKRTLRSLPSLPYEAMARVILGSKYDLSLIICGDTLARQMNATYRHKTYVPNVLSFPYSGREGEIFLNVRKAEREARQIGTSPKARLAILFVHGCFHLKGSRHGATMEKLERSVLRKFGFV